MSLLYACFVLFATAPSSLPNPANIFNIYSATDKPCTTDVIAFSVGRTTGFAPSADSRILMDHVYYNKEGHFDMTKSEFKAPVDGVYEFSFGATSEKGKPIYLLLYVHHTGKPNQIVASSFNYHSGAPSHKQASTVVYIEMKRGETASLGLAGKQAIYGQKSAITTQFSGHLLK